MSDEFFNVCRSLNIEILFSEYPIKLNYEDLVQFVRNKGIVSDIFRHRNNFRYCVKSENANQNALENMYRCNIQGCPQLVGTTLFYCPQSAYVCYLNSKFHTTYKIEESDCLNLSKCKNQEEIYIF